MNEREVLSVVNNEDFVRRFGVLRDKVFKTRRDSDYLINESQMTKFEKLVKFFVKEVERLEGSVDDIKIHPKEEHGGLTVTFPTYDACDDKVREFCEAMCGCSAFLIDPRTDDSIEVSCTVPNVFVSVTGRSDGKITKKNRILDVKRLRLAYFNSTKRTGNLTVSGVFWSR